MRRWGCTIRNSIGLDSISHRFVDFNTFRTILNEYRGEFLLRIILHFDKPNVAAANDTGHSSFAEHQSAELV